MKFIQWLWILIFVGIIGVKVLMYEPFEIQINPSEGLIDQVEILNTQKLKANEIFDPVEKKYYTIGEFNTLSLDMYTHFKGIGPSLAKAIYDYIQEFGTFDSFEELTLVKGIGDKKLKGMLENSR
ncbi:ComEA family DNA-binding protein [Fusibacter tunisiensis]|uniref:Competence ComEA-like helix-hairpin-helix protein n=1 Tax=Fusibacter tunisiensis TaxID=1008308 RepID=A0ABS2MMW1_9FIRM|nr:helix-hairpin-helix domain-containing protein [Fusibacter tunisiensis]MBM7560740.1 competence ComEA-like helix-hairpin-helix protein [Fusibacter tunisiensis]